MNLELLSKDDIQVVINRMDKLDRKLDQLIDASNRGEYRLIDVPEICQRLGISDNSFYKLALANQLPFLQKLGSRWKASEKDLNEFLSKGKHHEEKRNHLR